MTIHDIIMAAKLGRERKQAQIDTCAVFAAALYDVLTERGIPCSMHTVSNRWHRNAEPDWYHALLRVDGKYYDSLGEFSTEIYRGRNKIHPKVDVFLEFKPDSRPDCYEDDYDELHKFFVKTLRKAFDAARTN